MSTSRIKEFWLKNEQKIVLLVGFCLVSALSFEFGVLQGQKWQQKPLIIEKPAEISQSPETQNQGIPEAPGAVRGASTSSSKPNIVSSELKAGSSSCAFVGSKNSNKFYLSTCSYAKRVKPENLACYNSEADALAKGKVKSECK